MILEPKQDLLGIAITQLLILNIAWAFFIVVRVKSSLALPDAVAIWVYRNPTETTLVVTVVATVASSLTLSCFTRAAKHALRQYIGARRSISLVNLSIGIAAAKASFSFKRRPRYLGPALGTLFIATVFGLVNSAWTTFLSPAQVNVLVFMHGEELDLGNQAFDVVLGRDTNDTFGFSNGTLITQPVSSNSLISFGFTAGSSTAATYASGQPRTLNFNNATYNVSTGGILPAVPGYGGTNDAISTSASGTPASFGGGPFPTNLNANFGLAGISSTYTIIQQGLTANVSCFNYTNPADWYPFEIQAIAVNATLVMDPYLSGVLPAVNTTVPRIICNPNISGDGNTASIAMVNYDNVNYLASVICPATWQDSLNTDKIVVYHSGVGKYASLPPTICEIVLLLTQSSVVYANQLVASTSRNTTAIPHQHNLNFWVTLFVELEEWGFQTGRLNSLGDMLLSLLASGSASFSDAPVHSSQLFLEYWRGVVEVAGTALRTGYTAYPQNVTSMRTPISGTQNISTMGWSFESRTRVYALVPITLTAAMTFAAIVFALYHVDQSEKVQDGREDSTATENVPSDGQLGSLLVVPHRAVETFDASDPIHLLVAASSSSSARRLAPVPHAVHRGRYWDQHEDATVFFQLEL